jgi:raffinose/stachyose/melibiose transport system substrate-binding protein
MSQHKLLGLLLIVTLLSVGLVSCGGATPPAATEAPEPTEAPTATKAPEPTEAPTATKAPEPTEAPAEPVEITFWNTLDKAVNPSAYEWRAQMLEQFAKEYPNIIVKEEITPNSDWNVKISTAVASQTEPDVFYVRMGAWLDPYVEEGVLLPLNDYLEQDNWKDTFTSYLEVYNYGGQYYAVPLNTRTIRVYYNKALFEEYGLEVPETWDEMMAAVKTFRENDIIPFAAGNKQLFAFDWFYMYIHTRLNGYEDFQKFLARDGGPGFTAPSFLEAAQKFQELAQAGAFPEGATGLDFMEANALFWNEQAAMNNFIDLFWDMTKGSAPDVDIDFFEFPVFEGVTAEPKALCGGVGAAVAISSRSEHPDEAATFVKFWTRPDNVTKLTAATGWVTGVKDTIPEDASPYVKRLVDTIGEAPYVGYYYGDMIKQKTGQEVYWNGLAGLADGSLTPEQFVQSVEDSAKQEYGR